MAWGYMRAQSGGGGSAKQPVAELFRLGLIAGGDNRYGNGQANAYTRAFSTDGSTLICKSPGTYRIYAYGSFRYAYLYLKVNDVTRITVNGWTNSKGQISTAEEEVSLAAGDKVTFVSSLASGTTTFAAGNAVIYA